MLTKFNQLLTRSEATTLKHAAKILMRSDKHDQYFFKCLVELQHCADCVPHNVVNDTTKVSIGSDFALVKLSQPAKEVLNIVVEGKHHA